jgi:hypothetical protein
MQMELRRTIWGSNREQNEMHKAVRAGSNHIGKQRCISFDRALPGDPGKGSNVRLIKQLQKELDPNTVSDPTCVGDGDVA